MDTGILGTLGKIAGIGGLALGVLLLIFKDVIRRNIFPHLSPIQAFRIIRLILILTFLVAIAGISAWVYVSAAPQRTSKPNFSVSLDDEKWKLDLRNWGGRVFNTEVDVVYFVRLSKHSKVLFKGEKLRKMDEATFFPLAALVIHDNESDGSGFFVSNPLKKEVLPIVDKFRRYLQVTQPEIEGEVTFKIGILLKYDDTEGNDHVRVWEVRLLNYFIGDRDSSDWRVRTITPTDFAKLKDV